MIDRAVFAMPGVRPVLLRVSALILLRALAVVGQAAGLAFAITWIWRGSSLSSVLGWIALFFLCFVGRQVLVAVQDRMLERYARSRAVDLRRDLLSTVFRGGQALVSGEGSAALCAAVIEGVEHVESYIALIIPKMLSVAIVPVVLLLAMLPLDWVSCLIALACFPFIILYMVMIGHTAQDDAAKRHGAFERMSNHFVDSVRGVDTLKAFGLSRGFGDRIFEVSEKFREATMKTLRIATLSSAVLDTFATLALAAVAIMLGFRLVEGSLEFLPALMVLVMIPEYFRPIREFASDYHASLDGKTSLAQITRLIEEGRPCAWPDGLAGARSRSAGEAGGARAVVPASLAFEGVSCSYGDFDALRDVSFRIEGPAKVGVIGASGSGKSTLLSLIAGVREPDAGDVLIDGSSAASLKRESWLGRVAFIPQDPYLFHATLRENIAFYRPDTSDAAIERAVLEMGLSSMVEMMPEGLETRIGDGARSLSGGQAQRVALARAYLDPDRDVLLFDEPTAHLDIETEYELKASMLSLMEGRLAFIATHRLHWMPDLDYVLVLDGGRVVWQGTPAELRGSRAWADLNEKGGLR